MVIYAVNCSGGQRAGVRGVAGHRQGGRGVGGEQQQLVATARGKGLISGTSEGVGRTERGVAAAASGAAGHGGVAGGGRWQGGRGSERRPYLISEEVKMKDQKKAQRTSVCGLTRYVFFRSMQRAATL